ncbi:MAG TPA: serine/threonine-protein kinase [Pirellulaceae bacterium]|nr:serine/threonine-protein kinase [Pirellulaceae bacterium]HMO94094.1 serine/threonine-protein kinase [Pirellulaceae bacterium]HMP71021.1 serine/threonine-protein kinase [Pirellulaceae bacterium]
MSDKHDMVDDDPRMLELAREFLSQLEAGESPNRSELINRYPQMATQLNEYFDGIELAHSLKPQNASGCDAETVQPQLPLGDFKIVRQIARGGMGVVYEAIQLSLGRRVALKVLPFAAALDERQLQRFKIESQAAAQLHHTNILPIYAVGCERGVHFYAMQFIEGRSLAELLDEWRSEARPSQPSDPRQQRLPSHSDTVAVTRTQTLNSRKERWRTAAKIMAEVADAVDFAHAAGVVHRDVKPANILLNDKGRVWVTDFGLAQIASDVSLTRSGELLGTLRYMSPEQAIGQRGQVDHRADIYSLGVTLYEMLTLQPMFSGDAHAALLYQILHQEPKYVRNIDRSIPVELETIVLKAIAKAPEERYVTAAEFAEDLRRFLTERPILARRPTMVERLRKWTRRHPGYLIAAGLMCLVSAIVMGIATGRVWQEQQRTKLALQGEQQRTIQAESRLALAQRAADEMIQIAEDESLDNPFQEGLRARLLETVLQYYQEFIDESSDRPGDQAILEATRDRVEKILDDLELLRADRQFFLLRDPQVLADIQTTSEQRESLKEVLGEFPQIPIPSVGPGPLPPVRTDLAGPGPNGKVNSFKSPIRNSGPSHFVEHSREQAIAIARRHNEKLSAILSEEQLLRLNQIAIQLQGVSAFRDYDVVKRLELTKEQQENIKNLMGRRPPFGRDSRRGPGNGFAPIQDGELLEQILDTLTPAQLTDWKFMVGEPLGLRADQLSERESHQD